METPESIRTSLVPGEWVLICMQACHWKTHNTFTNFYLKDLTWSDDNNMYLGPVVAAQQVLDPSPELSSSERKEGGGGGGGGTSATPKSSGV